ncbi:MAG TPA: hypothetical protein PKC24_01295 [Cyclobacteriaceae bacterium]|nr:hypothetical protein [Cyclobacteriaceae bacterium]
MKYFFSVLVAMLLALSLQAQEKSVMVLPSETDLKENILQLRTELDVVKLNLATTKKKLQRGVLVATLGYSITITGGLMLGRSNDQLGQALLVAGGITGITGTYMMVDSFKYMDSTISIKEKTLR